MNALTSFLASPIARFMVHKRARGLTYRTEEQILHALDRLASDQKDDGVLDEPLVRRFLAGTTRPSRSHRLTVVRQLARFLTAEGSPVFVPPSRFLAIRRHQPVIRVLTREEVPRFLCASEGIEDSPGSPHRALIHGTALRVLLLTGLRRGEILRLTDMDVDLGGGVLTIHGSKFGKSRFVPLADDLTDALRRYRAALWKRVPKRQGTDAFFPGRDGHRPFHPNNLYYSFRETIARAGIKHGGRGEGPRIHDLRHTFAVLRLIEWYAEGADLSAKLPLLATYLGHVALVSTQVYLHMTQDLVGEVARRHEVRFGDIITAEVTR